MAEVQIARLVASFEANSRKFDSSIRKIEADSRRTAALLKQHFGPSARTFDGLGASALRADAVLTRLRQSLNQSAERGMAAAAVFRRLAAAVGVALTVREVVQSADAWQQYANKMAGAGAPAEKVNDQLNELVAVALRTRTGLEPVVDLFSKLTLAAEQYGLSAAQATRITETVSKAMKVGGASVAEQSSAILQLSQAIGSGVLQGDELRSLRENAPLLTKALAKELGVTTGKLKQLGEEGKLTGDVILRAMLKASSEIDAAFGKTVPTVADAFTNAKTAFTALVGEFDKGAGITRQISEALTGTGAKMEELKAGAQGWGAYLAQEAENALKKVKPLYDLLNKLGELTPISIAISTLRDNTSEAERGKAMLRRGLGKPLATKPEEVAAFYDMSGAPGEIKKPPKDTKKIDDEIKSVERRTAALQVETEVVGKSVREAERARTIHELLAEAKKNEIPVSDELRAKIEAVGTAYAEQAAKLDEARKAHEKLEDAQREMASASAEFAKGFLYDMRAGVSATEALGNALERLAERMMDRMIDQTFMSLLGPTSAGGAGGGGAGGGILSLITTLFKGFAGGGLVHGPGSSTSDSVPARLSRGEYVVNAAATRRSLPLLEAINSGGRLAAFASGGLVEPRRLSPGLAAFGETCLTVQPPRRYTIEVTR
ncbi:hypothetical protein CCR97_19005 [Rhodoplanes elegans]|uniref:Tape measure protein N-terminal domain-containing protein n=1 Tax=Rhodoplanes elegans TaxID=29408 RepID=A0A327KTR6_9BRAD|nr:tape measure protein [Rhodoplanes elegans]MBK5960274.1 hypothetical protein [Rhodoplanes elegans]RAI40722.1 hypothetical protein CH338_05390 [Rhodoplanes elegans]